MSKQEMIFKKGAGKKASELYIKGAVAYYAKVHKPDFKYRSTTEKEYSVNVFFNKEVADQLEDLGINKTIAEVDVTKITKGENRNKVRFSSEKMPEVEGLFGFSAGCNEFFPKGDPQRPRVIDTKGKPFLEDLGNGSVITVKLRAVMSEEGLYNLYLDTVMVLEHVPYEGGQIVDDVLGVTYDYDMPTVVEKEEPEAPFEREDEGGDEDFDDDIPY